jgi:fumarate reductase iron-sulfur subunit
MSPERIRLEVFRHRPDMSDLPTFQTYEVPLHENWAVLDALNHIKDELDGTLSHRWSCRTGLCGSCGVSVNGRPSLACATHLRDHMPGPIRIEPLAHFPVIRDLVVDITDSLKKLRSVKPWIIREEDGDLSEQCVQTPAQLEAYRRLSLCLHCGLCQAACPVCGHDPSYLGPAAIVAARRHSLDSRDEAAGERAEIISRHGGIWNCTLSGDCSRVCPASVDPSAAIQLAKAACAPSVAGDPAAPSQGPVAAAPPRLADAAVSPSLSAFARATGKDRSACPRLAP